jgi:hypothetical protein
MNEKQLFIQMFKSAQTTIVDLAEAEVSSDNLKSLKLPHQM